MSRGRPPLGVQLVDSLEGSAPAKERLKVVLETLAGTKTVSEACAELGLGETALRELRGQALQELVRLLEPRPPGRPKQAALPREQEVAALQAENQELRLKLRGLQIREEIAVAMPHLLKGHGPEGHGPGGHGVEGHGVGGHGPGGHGVEGHSPGGHGVEGHSPGGHGPADLSAAALKKTAASPALPARRALSPGR